MNLSCTHEKLLTTLNYLEWVVGRHSHLPILSNILFEAEEGRLRLLATNLEIGVIAELGAKVEGEGKMVLPAKLLSQFIQNLDVQEVVHFEQVGNQVIVKNTKDEMRINCIESKDFPLIPEYTGTYPIHISGAILSEAFRKVLFAVSTNENRIELTGVFLVASDRGIHLTATDSFRLAEVTLSGLEIGTLTALKSFLQDLGGGIILPVDTLQELGRIIQKGDEEVMMALQENQVFFEVSGVKIVSRVIQGRYPDYQQIIPKEFQLKVEVGREELVRTLKMATNFAQYGSGEVRFRFLAEQGALELSTMSSGVGEQRTLIPLSKAPPEDRDIVFQPRHVLDGVNALSGESITFELNSKDMPVLLSGDQPNQHLYLVMPIRK